ncbi:MAG: 16S rRNA (guanine(966)-N(2))-methyltransferase RsmD [Solobacterium sp.]|nr:16S rRNA (guanine(966)-N(2))-methyltransferase RsmD [Solobacterium sp.]
MRIIAGTRGSRRIEAPVGKDTRPTLDKVREAVFSSLGGFFEGGAVLDLYAGSGAIGLEALSRGMDQAVFVEPSRKARDVILRNIEALQFQEESRILPMKAAQAVRQLTEEGRKFDLVYLDPPYAKQENEEILTDLVNGNLLNPGAVCVVESLKEEQFPEVIGSLVRYKEAVYGISRISYYRLQGE